MTPERWQQVKELFRSALEHEPEGRAAFLERACDGDDPLRREVESLLKSFEGADSFMETPVAEAAAELLGDKDESLVGRRLGRYEVVAPLGEGGMGTVWLAKDTRLGRKVAVKLLPPHFTEDAERLRRFEREARAASSLNHPNILTIYEIGEDDGRHFIATEFIEGETLRERMAGAPMEVGEALDVAGQVASALAAAHEAGIVHRDIKPENVMVRRDHLVKVLDFGLAKLTEQRVANPEAATRAPVKTSSGVILGTVTYMSPEQARGLEVDARTDIWSLGVVLYEMIAGRVPFEGPTTGDRIVSILEREPAPLAHHAPEVPEALAWVVTKALTKEREGRYQTVREMLTDLRRLQRQREVAAELERSAAPGAAMHRAAQRLGQDAGGGLRFAFRFLPTRRGGAGPNAVALTGHHSGSRPAGRLAVRRGGRGAEARR